MAKMRPPRKLYRIGEIIKYTGLSRQTLHYYTMLGLIQEEERTDAGHRLYGEGVFETLSEIEGLKKEKTLAEIRNLLMATLKELNDVRLPGEGRDPTAVSTMSILVVIASSLAGGVGSAITLPLCGEVKRAMDQLGMDVSQSLFLGVFFTAECFPETGLRLSNTYETLADCGVAQWKGVIP